MDFRIQGRPEFFFTLTLEEVTALIRLSEAHYDGACKEASRPGPNGFLYGWKNRLTWATEEGRPTPQISATWRELDLVLKITEVWHGVKRDEDAEIGMRLHFSFRQAMTHFSQTISPIWTATFRSEA
jgi:hypothetical protein